MSKSATNHDRACFATLLLEAEQFMGYFCGSSSGIFHTIGVYAEKVFNLLEVYLLSDCSRVKS